MTEVRRERVADIVRQELPYKSIYGLIALNVALLFCVAFVVSNVHQGQNELARQAFEREETQRVWNASLKGQLEGMKATVEFGPRIAALEIVQKRQLDIIAAIAKRLGIEEIDYGRGTEREADSQHGSEEGSSGAGLRAVRPPRRDDGP